MDNFYISDVDFTLLPSNRVLPADASKKIQHIWNENIPFTIATARSVFSLENLLGNLKFPLPVIEFNGGYVTNYEDKQPEAIFDLNRNIVTKLIELSGSIEFDPLISAYGRTQLVFPPKKSNFAFDAYLQERRELKDARIQPETPFSEILNHKILAITYMGKENEIAELYDQIKADKHIVGKTKMHYYENKYTPDTYWLTVHSDNSTKEHAIEVLRERYNLKDHNLVVFGDDVNDIGMLSLADTAIAVENAKPEVKEIADIIIGTNDEGSVLDYIINNEDIVSKDIRS